MLQEDDNKNTKVGNKYTKTNILHKGMYFGYHRVISELGDGGAAHTQSRICIESFSLVLFKGHVILHTGKIATHLTVYHDKEMRTSYLVKITLHTK